jgi:hypothetical protein
MLVAVVLAGCASDDGEGAEPDRLCFSPTQYQHLASEGIPGCACDVRLPPSCPLDFRYRPVPMLCVDGVWTAHEDASCRLLPGECISPTRNVDRAYERGTPGCACDPAVDGFACVTDSRGSQIPFECGPDGTWGTVQDGCPWWSLPRP